MNLEIFKNSGFELRGGLINNEPYFVAMDIAKALGYVDAYSMTRRLDDDEVQNHQISGFGNRGINLINESGLYNAILGSDKSEAKQFKKWVTSEVLPSIRKNGMYATAPTLENMINNPDFAISLLTKLKEEQELRRVEKELRQKEEEKVKTLEHKIEVDKPKVSFASTVESSLNSVLIRQWAKSINLKEKDVRAWLNEKKYIYRDSKSNWTVYATEKAKQYFELVPTTNSNQTGTHLNYTVKIKGEGQIALTDRILNDLKSK